MTSFSRRQEDTVQMLSFCRNGLLVSSFKVHILMRDRRTLVGREMRVGPKIWPFLVPKEHCKERLWEDTRELGRLVSKSDK